MEEKQENSNVEAVHLQVVLRQQYRLHIVPCCCAPRKHKRGDYTVDEKGGSLHAMLLTLQYLSLATQGHSLKNE